MATRALAAVSQCLRPPPAACCWNFPVSLYAALVQTLRFSMFLLVWNILRATGCYRVITTCLRRLRAISHRLLYGEPPTLCGLCFAMGWSRSLTTIC